MQFLLLIFLLISGTLSAKVIKTERELRQFLDNTFETNSNSRCNRLMHAIWDHKTDLNNIQKERTYVNASLSYAQGKRIEWNRYLKNVTAKKSWSDKTKREFGFVRRIGEFILENNDFSNLTKVIKDMKEINKVKICPYKKKKCKASEMLPLEPDVKKIMQESRNSDELLYYWKSWRDLVGSQVRNQFGKYVALSNKAAVLNGFKDTGQMWRSGYESSDFYNQVDIIWNEIRPLYNELHKYVIKKLRKVYKGQLDFDDGLIPAHILGDMWAHDWSHLFNILRPFPKSPIINITQELIDSRHYPIDMFRLVNSFYTSMGLMTNEMAYGSDSIIAKPDNAKQVVDCQPEAFDFCDRRTYRIRMCTNLTTSDFHQIFTEIGEIQYYQQYKSQPSAFRASANPAFLKAVGGAVALSAFTPDYLKNVQLLNSYKNTYSSAINRLMDMALKHIVNLPHALLVDKWRWDVFSGNLAGRWNSQWWRFREVYQKVKHPLLTDNEDFDPGAHYHLDLDIDGSHSIDQFIAEIQQFQIYRSLCITAKHYDPKNKTRPLSKCDFYQSRQAGSALSSGLSVGRSEHWKQVLKAMTGEENLNASAIVEYFEPLYDYLRQSNQISTEKPPTKKTNPTKKKKKKKKNKTKLINRERVPIPRQINLKNHGFTDGNMNDDGFQIVKYSTEITRDGLSFNTEGYKNISAETQNKSTNVLSLTSTQLDPMITSKATVNKISTIPETTLLYQPTNISRKQSTSTSQIFASSSVVPSGNDSQVTLPIVTTEFTAEASIATIRNSSASTSIYNTTVNTTNDSSIRSSSTITASESTIQNTTVHPLTSPEVSFEISVGTPPNNYSTEETTITNNTTLSGTYNSTKVSSLTSTQTDPMTMSEATVNKISTIPETTLLYQPTNISREQSTSTLQSIASSSEVPSGDDSQITLPIVTTEFTAEAAEATFINSSTSTAIYNTTENTTNDSTIRSNSNITAVESTIPNTTVNSLTSPIVTTEVSVEISVGTPSSNYPTEKTTNTDNTSIAETIKTFSVSETTTQNNSDNTLKGITTVAGSKITSSITKEMTDTTTSSTIHIDGENNVYLPSEENTNIDYTSSDFPVPASISTASSSIEKNYTIDIVYYVNVSTTDNTQLVVVTKHPNVYEENGSAKVVGFKLYVFLIISTLLFNFRFVCI